MRGASSMRLGATSLVIGALVACTGGSTPPDGGSAATGSDAGSPKTCDELASAASDLVSAAIAHNTACTDNLDCVGTELAAACFDSCERPINKRGASDVEAARATANRAYCAPFSAKGCKSFSPPCAPPDNYRCVNGTCQGVPGAGYNCPATKQICSPHAEASPTGTSCVFDCDRCVEFSDLANTNLASVIDAHQSCSGDEDCVVVDPSVSCRPACSAVMNKSGNAALAAAKDNAETNICNNFEGTGCDAFVPSCLAPPAIVHCVTGKCQ